MRHHTLAAVSIAASIVLAIATTGFAQAPAPRGPAGAPPPAAPAKPYKPVAITPPTPVADPSFEAFRKQLGAAAEKKNRGALAAMVSPTFFWMGEKGDHADKKKPGIDNLAKAIGLDAKDGPGWDMLNGAAADPTGAAFPDRKDTICAPADPGFDEKALEDLSKSTGTDPSDWAFPTQPGVPVHSAAQPNAPVVEKLGMNFVRVMQDDAPPNQDAPMIRVVTPSGKTGFVPADALNPLGNDQLCYSKEGGGWKISGYVGGDQ
jgi:hypothetical protein